MMRAVRRLFWLLALALLMAQTLGQLHGSVHGPLVEMAHELEAAHDHDHAHTRAHTDTHERGSGTGHGGDWLGKLFPHDSGDPDCRLYDQVSHGDASWPVITLALPLVLYSFVFQFVAGEVLRRWAALFEARGPPLTR